MRVLTILLEKMDISQKNIFFMCNIEKTILYIRYCIDMVAFALYCNVKNYNT